MYASLDEHSTSGFAHLLSDEQNLVTHFGVQLHVNTSAPLHEDADYLRWEATYEIGMPWSFATMN